MDPLTIGKLSGPSNYFISFTEGSDHVTLWVFQKGHVARCTLENFTEIDYESKLRWNWCILGGVFRRTIKNKDQTTRPHWSCKTSYVRHFIRDTGFEFVIKLTSLVNENELWLILAAVLCLLLSTGCWSLSFVGVKWSRFAFLHFVASQCHNISVGYGWLCLIITQLVWTHQQVSLVFIIPGTYARRKIEQDVSF